MDRFDTKSDAHDTVERDIATLQRMLEWAVMEMEDLNALQSAASLRLCIEKFRNEVKPG